MDFVFNGDINGKYIAIGKNPKIYATDHSNDRNEIITKLDEIDQMLTKYKDHLDNALELKNDISMIKDELNKISPNKISIDTKIDKLASTVSSVAQIADAINMLKIAICGFFNI